MVERSGAAYAALRRGELDALVADLPAIAPAPAASPPSVVLGIFGGGDKRDRWRVPERLTVVNVFGGSDLSLREAIVTSRQVVITVWSVFGGSDITVPAGVSVAMTGGAVFGGNDMRIDHPAVPGAPAITVRAFSLFGGTDVHDTERPRWRDRLGIGTPPAPPSPPGT